MSELVSLIFKLNNGLHRAYTNLTFVEASEHLFFHLNVTDPRADYAIGLMQLDGVSTVIEFNINSLEELSKTLYFYKIQFTNFKPVA